jgi:hypothetical protein
VQSRTFFLSGLQTPISFRHRYRFWFQICLLVTGQVECQPSPLAEKLNRANSIGSVYAHNARKRNFVWEKEKADGAQHHVMLQNSTDVCREGGKIYGIAPAVNANLYRDLAERAKFSHDAQNLIVAQTTKAIFTNSGN